MRKKLLIFVFGIFSFLLFRHYFSSHFSHRLEVSAQTPSGTQNTARIQGRRVDIDNNSTTAPVPPDGSVSTITVKESGENGATIGSFTIKTSSSSAQINGETVTNSFSTGNTLTMGKEYVISINEIPGYKAMYSMNKNNIRHQQDTSEDAYLCATTDTIYCYQVGNSVTVTIPTELPKNADGSDYPNAYIDIYWKYLPAPTLNPSCPKKPQGDANCDQVIDLKDYEIWKCEFLGDGVCSKQAVLPTGTPSTLDWANFNFQNFDDSVNLVDFEIWRKNSGVYPTSSVISPTPSVSTVPTNPPVSTITPSPTKTPTPTPTPAYQSRILFTSNRFGNNDIFVKELNGQENRLTTSDANDYEPKISKSGTTIVFTSYRDLNNEIYVMNANGTNQINLTNNSNSDINPVMSPDGTKIAFSSNRNREGNYDLYLMDLQGTVTRLTNKPLDDTQPNFSPDGKKIVFTSYRDGQPEIYTLDLTKPNADPALNYDPQRWTNSPALDFQPAFDPTDNSKIIFTSSRPGYYRVYSMSLVKSVTKPFPDVVRLNNITGNYNDIEPSFSWDGSRIVFISQRVKNLEIWAMNSDGTNQDRITDNTDNDATPVFFP